MSTRPDIATLSPSAPVSSGSSWSMGSTSWWWKFLGSAIIILAILYIGKPSFVMKKNEAGVVTDEYDWTSLIASSVIGGIIIASIWPEKR